jgi:hypothetical protein
MMIPFTLNEIRHVITLFGQAAVPPAVITWWSDWHRVHRARARRYHYQHRSRADQGTAAPAAAAAAQRSSPPQY